MPRLSLYGFLSPTAIQVQARWFRSPDRTLTDPDRHSPAWSPTPTLDSGVIGPQSASNSPVGRPHPQVHTLDFAMGSCPRGQVFPCMLKNPSGYNNHVGSSHAREDIALLRPDPGRTRMDKSLRILLSP